VKRTVIAIAFLFAGCPREVDVPPGGGDPCDTMADCNERTCGDLRACVAGSCEEGMSIYIPCLDSGP
jgi:hypothetical protein